MYNCLLFVKKSLKFFMNYLLLKIVTGWGFGYLPILSISPSKGCYYRLTFEKSMKMILTIHFAYLKP